MKEKEIENQILHYLRGIGIFCWKTENQGTFDARKGIYRRKSGPGRMLGISDIIGCLFDGRLFACEVKSEKGRLSEPQKIFLDHVNAQGGVGFMARSVQDVRDELRSRGYDN